MAEHPELDTSPADEARAVIDIDLKRSCPPGLWVPPPIADSGTPSETLNTIQDENGDAGRGGNSHDGIPGAFEGSVEDCSANKTVIPNDEGTCLPERTARNARTKGSVITAVRWDDAGEVKLYEVGVQNHKMMRVVQPSVSEFTRELPNNEKAAKISPCSPLLYYR